MRETRKRTSYPERELGERGPGHLKKITHARGGRNSSTSALHRFNDPGGLPDVVRKHFGAQRESIKNFRRLPCAMAKFFDHRITRARRARVLVRGHDDTLKQENSKKRELKKVAVAFATCDEYFSSR